jgi:hypothetical protein
MAMSDDEKPEKGTVEGPHAPRSDPIAADLQRLAAERDQAEPEQPDLLAGSLEIHDQDVLAVASELVAAPRRERGRPPGSSNRRNSQMFDYLAQLGHRHPAVTLSMIQTADTKALARAICADAIDVLRLQVSAASALLPYDLAKKPQAIELPPGAPRPLMVIGEMNVIGQQNVEFMSVGEPAKKPNEINGRAVRLGEDESHDTSQDIDNAGETGSETPD